MTPELSRRIPVERMPAAVTVEATAEECEAIAKRMHIPGVESLVCRYTLRRRGDAVEAEGVLEADVIQSCVVTLEPVAQHVHERFAVRFVPAGQETEDENPDSPDELPYENDAIDLGEATAEQLALALDPYPRAEGAEFTAGGDDGAQTPFARLAGLRPKS